MKLEIPIPVSFTVKTTTDKAIIAQDIMLRETQYIKEAVLPKMYTIINETKKGITTAVVEKWVLLQRYTEEQTVDVESHVDELLAV